MPVVLAPEAWQQWLGEEPTDEADLMVLLAPYAADGMVCSALSPASATSRTTIRAWPSRLFCHNRAALPDCGSP